jgi:hypothetical protein
MNDITAHLTRAAARESRAAARHAVTGCILLLSFPAENILPFIQPILLPALLFALLCLSFALTSLFEVIRLEKLKKRYNSTQCPPIQL